MLKDLKPRRWEWCVFIAVFVLAGVSLLGSIEGGTDGRREPLHYMGSALPPTVRPQATPTALPLPTPTPNPNWGLPVPDLNPGHALRDAMRDVANDTVNQVLGSAPSWWDNLENWLGREKSILLWTDPTLTYANEAIQDILYLIIIVVDSALLVMVALAGYELMLGAIMARYIHALDVLPRLILAFVGTSLSLWFAKWWIDLNNLLCQTIGGLTNYEPFPPPIDPKSVLIGNVPLMVILVLLSLLAVFLAVQALGRFALVDLLLVLLPVFFLALGNHQTRLFGQIGLRSFVAAVMAQFVQVVCLTVGNRLLAPFLINSLHVGPTTTTLVPITAMLTAFATMWLALRIPSLLQSWMQVSLHDAGRALRSTVHYGVNRALFWRK